MENPKSTPVTIDEYLSVFPKAVQETMEEVRKIIHATVPGLKETISYGMPAFNLNGRPLVYFAAWKKHVGFYPAPDPNEKFEVDLSGYTMGRGSIQFPFDKPLPVELIVRLVEWRLSSISAEK